VPSLRQAVAVQRYHLTRAAQIGLGIAVAVAAYLGWREFWFLTDDAFIAFRYVSNSMLGRGLVWNPAPFVPVEGYTSFLWVVLLRGVWSVTGIEPPEAANWLALGFGYGTLAFGAALVMRMQLPERAERLRLALLAFVMLWTLTNRTFLTWLSSGLEASLFTFAATYWVWAGTRRSSPAAYVAHLAAASSLVALTRPDGLLFASAALVMMVFRIATDGHARAVKLWRYAVAAVPLAFIPAHLVFRHSTYGYWVPNTYFAKYVAPWPEAGWRYIGSFVVEYGLWAWILVALACGVLFVVRALRGAPIAWRDPSLWLCAGTCGALFAHFAFYTWIIGGDHFEYRVYAHLVLPLGIALVWMASRIPVRLPVVLAIVSLAIACSWPLPWLHWQLGHQSKYAKLKHGLAIPLAQSVPELVRPAVAVWDDWQAWLASHAVCARQQEHKRFSEHMQRLIPARSVGAKYAWDERPVIAWRSIGILSWSLPNVAVIDRLGLNDRIIARVPVTGGHRAMAHDRRPPAGYVECFRPNLHVYKGKSRIDEREEPLTDDQIRACDSLERWIHR
jgi:arabinofuranosyltransferase